MSATGQSLVVTTALLMRNDADQCMIVASYSNDPIVTHYWLERAKWTYILANIVEGKPICVCSTGTPSGSE